MKLLSLNTWGGREFEALKKFLEEQRQSVDIFCFQEITQNGEGLTAEAGFRANFFQDLKEILPEYRAYFHPCIFDNLDIVLPKERFTTEHKIELGNALFIKNNLDVLDEGEEWIFKDTDAEFQADKSRNIALINLSVGGKNLWIFNYHGISFPGTKVDTPKRLEQSEKLIVLLNSKEGEKILCGDFNLEIFTKSIRMLEDAGMENLIKKFNIKDTRGPINKKIYEGLSDQAYADFTFASEGIDIKSFEVPWVPVSDHLPMILEFEL